jgi:arylesterase / paraoxonase
MVFFSSTDRIVDNLSIDKNGALWAAGISASFSWISAYHDPEKMAPSSALRITKNVGSQAFFGEKLRIDKVRYTLRSIIQYVLTIRG